MGSGDGHGEVPRFDPDRSFWPHRSASYDINSKLMLTAIASLSAVILLVVALHLYARCVFRRRRNRYRSAFLLHRFAAQPPKRGLDPAVIDSLPTFVVGGGTDGPDGPDDATSTAAIECAVCLNVLEEHDTARVLPNCKHVFHVDCIDAWLAARSTCPICRAEAEPRPRLEPEPREGPVGGGGAPPSAPPLDDVRLGSTAEASSGDKTAGSASRLNSFRRILSRERSSNRNNPAPDAQQDPVQDLERQ